MSTWRSQQEEKCPKEAKIAIVAAEFNGNFVESLLENTTQTLLECGAQKENIDVFRVPGSFELPYACKKVSEKKTYSAIIALGVILRGETIHFDIVANETARGLMDINLSLDIPVVFGVLACENEAQVHHRLSLGRDFAKTAIQMMKY